MDERVFIRFEHDCHFCGNPATWSVYENRYTPDHLDVCDTHKYTAYS